MHETVNNLQTERGRSQTQGAMALLVPDPLTLHPQSVIIKGPLYLVAGLDLALHPGKRVWFPMEMLVQILGLGRYYADCIAALKSKQ